MVIAKPAIETADEPVVERVPARRVRTTQLLDRQGRHRYALVVTVAALVVMALLALVLQAKSSPAPTRPTRDAAPIVPSPPPRPAPPPAPAVSAPRTTVMLEVTSNPSGATVVLDGVRLGVTPFSAPVPIKSDDAWLKVRLHGYAAVKTRVSLANDVTWNVPLRKLSKQ
jgi:hypothetical protein